MWREDFGSMRKGKGFPAVSKILKLAKFNKNEKLTDATEKVF